jgi:hypothetical protein
MSEGQGGLPSYKDLENAVLDGTGSPHRASANSRPSARSCKTSKIAKTRHLTAALLYMFPPKTLLSCLNTAVQCSESAVLKGLGTVRPQEIVPRFFEMFGDQ